MEPPKELIEASRAGDRLAQERLVLKVQDHVYRRCRRMLLNEDDALDVTQDALLAMLRGLAELREPQAFWGWLNRITVNLCCKQLRGRRELPLSEVEAALDTYENFDDQAIPERVLDNEENRRLIVELIEGLPEAQRLCVLCYYYNEMSIRDIAAAMETSENTVKSRLHYARQSIKEGVERYTAQGLRLYTFSPLPFIQYFLQQEAGDSLPPAAAQAIGQALLAAGALGAAGTAGSAGMGAAVTASAKAAGGAAAHKGLLALAGLVLAGIVGGSSLPRSTQSPAEAPAGVPAAQELVLPPAPEEPELLALPETPEPSLAEAAEEAPRVPAVIWSPVLDLSPGSPAEPEPLRQGGSGEADSSSVPSPAPEFIPSSAPDPVLSPSPEPEPAPTPASKPEPQPDPQPDPTPTPDPSPQPQPTPVLPSVTQRLYSPNPNFGVYLGENDSGVHEFTLEILPDRQKQPYPFLPGHYFGKVEITDAARVGHISEYIYGIAPGTCDVRYYVSPSSEGPFELKAIAHVTVIPSAPITANYDWGTYRKTSGGVAYFSRTAAAGNYILDSPLVPGNYLCSAKSSNPAAVTVLSTGQLYAAGPGSAEIRYYTRWVEKDPWTLAAVVQMTVQEGPVQTPAPPAAEKEISVGYGYVADFAGVWAEALPENLEYASSKPSVARISDKGEFAAYAPGSAVLTARDPADPGRQYVLAVQVEDRFHWNHNLQDITVIAGESVSQSLAPYQLKNACLTGAYWVSADPLTATLKGQDTEKCEIMGVAPGVTEVEAQLFFLVQTPEGEKSMKDTVSFQVRVEEPAPPEDGITVFKQELVKFGYCSGYGCSLVFSDLWTECQLPETLVYTSSDPHVAHIDNTSGRFTTLSGGTAVLTARDPGDPARQYELTIQVQDCFDWSYQFEDVRIRLEDGYETNSLTYSVSGASIQSTKFTSSDPSVVEIHFSGNCLCSLRGLKPGTVDLDCEVTFQVHTWSGYTTLRDTITCKATAAYSEGTEVIELTEFGNRSGYGYSAAFSSHYPGLPEGTLYYGSSNYNVASIKPDGTFTTLAPGRAVLSAYAPEDQQHTYSLVLEVQDHFEWELELEDLTLEQGGAASCGFDASKLPPGVSITWAIWSAGDPLMLSVTRRAGNHLMCEITALQPGVTYVTASLDLHANGCNFQEKVSFRVTVPIPQPEDTAGDAGAEEDAPEDGESGSPGEISP